MKLTPTNGSKYSEDWMHCVEDPTFVIFSYVLFSTIFLPTILGNSLIVVSIAKFRHLRSNMHILIGNLAVSDLLIGVCIILQVVGNFADGVALNRNFCLGQNAVFVVSLGTSSLNLLAISTERFIALKFPLQHRFKFTRRITYYIISGCWLSYILIALLPVIGWNDFHEDIIICDTDLVWTKGYDIMIFGCLLAIMIINTVLAIFVIKIIKEANFRTLQYSRSNSNSFKSHALLGNLRRTKMTLVVFGFFALCWTPYLIVSLVMIFEYDHKVRCARQWCICPGIVNSACNWIIYGLANRQFREAFKAVLKRQTIVELRGSVRRATIRYT